jgi:CubicO group peptidase (beta-lactamase class C family)
MTGVAATPDMHFRNGAVAIAYLATVLLQLSDQGILDLDDRLSTWFPKYPKAEQITLTMLMNGTSGYADYVTDEAFVRALYANPFRHWLPEELIAIGLDRPMICDPGACWSYAHTNFVILGKVLERASGRALEVLISEGILDPLSLADTRSESTAIIQEPVLHSFDAERGRYEESTYWDPSWTLASGAIMTSNVADILKSAAAIGEGALVSPKSHALQLAPLTAKYKPWSETSYYGFGVFIINGWIVQNPSFAGYAATMAYLPSRKLALAVSVTLGENASTEGNLSTDVLEEIAAYLAPEAPLK